MARAERGESVKVRVGKICTTCQWYGSFTQSCSYCDLNHVSRLKDSKGNKVDPKYCVHYVKGEPKYDNSQWGKNGVIRVKKRG